MKRAREQAVREKRELKQAKKDARAAARIDGPDLSAEFDPEAEIDPEDDVEREDAVEDAD